MYRDDIKEAVPIITTVLRSMLAMTATRGRTGSDLRASIGVIITHAGILLATNKIGPPLDACFDFAKQAGITYKQMERVREVAEEQETKLLGATLIKNSLIQFALATQASIIAETKFVSRQDVEDLKKVVNSSYNAMEEITADDMDQMVYRAVVQLHAAVICFLVETARPLPRMLRYHFTDTISSLAMAYKLYDTAGRADELRDENKIVHPAFMPRNGMGLSA